jgi:hypothetical protein
MKSLLIKAAITINRIADYKCYVLCRAAARYFELADPINSALISHGSSRLEILETNYDALLVALRHCVRRLSAIRNWSLIGRIGVLRSAQAAGRETLRGTAVLGRFGVLAGEVGLNAFECLLAGLSLGTTQLALKVGKHELRTRKSRSNSLREIIKGQDSPIFFHELVLWTITRAGHAEEVLGDFRETFEKRRAQFGAESAMRWSREQITREVWNRAKSAVKIFGWLGGAFHAIARHLRK